MAQRLGALTAQQVRKFHTLRRLRQRQARLDRELYLAREQLLGKSRLFHADIVRSLLVKPQRFMIDPHTYEVFVEDVTAEAEGVLDLSVVGDALQRGDQVCAGPSALDDAP